MIDAAGDVSVRDDMADERAAGNVDCRPAVRNRIGIGSVARNGGIVGADDHATGHFEVRAVAKNARPSLRSNLIPSLDKRLAFNRARTGNRRAVHRNRVVFHRFDRPALLGKDAPILHFDDNSLRTPRITRVDNLPRCIGYAFEIIAYSRIGNGLAVFDNKLPRDANGLIDGKREPRKIQRDAFLDRHRYVFCGVRQKRNGLALARIIDRSLHRRVIHAADRCDGIGYDDAPAAVSPLNRLVALREHIVGGLCGERTARNCRAAQYVIRYDGGFPAAATHERASFDDNRGLLPVAPVSSSIVVANVHGLALRRRKLAAVHRCRGLVRITRYVKRVKRCRMR